VLSVTICCLRGLLFRGPNPYGKRLNYSIIALKNCKGNFSGFQDKPLEKKKRKINHPNNTNPATGIIHEHEGKSKVNSGKYSTRIL
jgi:hypothetical protein